MVSVADMAGIGSLAGWLLLVEVFTGTCSPTEDNDESEEFEVTVGSMTG